MSGYARLSGELSELAKDVLTLPHDAKAGDTIDCCGRRYRLSFEYLRRSAAEEP